MTRLLRAAARLYPRAWRVRYGREFDALIDDLTPRWGSVFNIAAGALAMQITRPFVIPLVLAMGGFVAGALISLLMPPVYASSSQVLVRVPDASAGTSERAQRIRTAIDAALEETAFDTRTITVTLRGEPGSDPVLLEVSGSADSAHAAKQATDKALGRIIEANMVASGRLTPNPGVQFRVMETASLPTAPQRDTMRISTIGGALGVLVGVVAAFAGQRRRRAVRP
jgi:hypothetical protein